MPSAARVVEVGPLCFPFRTPMAQLESPATSRGDDKAEEQPEVRALAWAIDVKSLQPGAEVTTCPAGTATFKLQDGVNVTLKTAQESESCSAEYRMEVHGDRLPFDATFWFDCQSGGEQKRTVQQSLDVKGLRMGKIMGRVSEDGDWLLLVGVTHSSKTD